MEGSHLNTLSGNWGPSQGVEVTDVAPSGSKILLSQTYGPDSGLIRVEFSGKVLSAHAKKPFFIRVEENAEFDFSISEGGRYSVRVVGSGDFVYNVPGYNGVDLDPGVYEFHLSSGSLGMVEQLSFQVYPWGEEPVDGMSDSFLFLKRPYTTILDPQHAGVMGNTAANITYSFENSGEYLIPFATQAILKVGERVFFEIGEKIGSQDETGVISFPIEYPDPGVPNSGTIYRVGVRISFHAPVGDYFHETIEQNMGYVEIVSPHAPTDPSDLNPSLRISEGRFHNGKTLMVFPNPIMGRAKALFVNGESLVASIFDIRGRKVGELRPQAVGDGFWESAIVPSELGLSSGIYFIAAGSGDDGKQNIERIVLIK